MDPLRPSSSELSSRCLDIRSDRDIVLEGRDRTRHVLAQTPGYAQPSNGGLSPQHASFVSARYDAFQGTGLGAIPSGEPASYHADYLYQPAQDTVSPTLYDILAAYPSSPFNDYVRSNTSSPPLDGHNQRAYMNPVKHSRYDGDSFFQFLDAESAALQYLSSSSPPQSSSPLPQSSPPLNDWGSSICLTSNVLDPIQEEDSFAQVPFSSTPDLSSDSPHSTASYHSRSSTFDKYSSKSSLTSRSSRSKSSSRSRSDSPDGAHTNTGYEFNNAHERDDEFTDRLHELLLVVAREREREQEPEHVVEYDEDCFGRSTRYAYGDIASDYIELSPPCDSRGYKLSSRASGMQPTLSRIACGRYRIDARSRSPFNRDDYELKSATFSASPTLYSPSAVVSPINRSSFFHEEYQDGHAKSETEIDTLVFASPSCSPPPRTFKRPRSLSIDQTDIDDFPFTRKLQKTGSSVFSS
jgi:hypothetical protein